MFTRRSWLIGFGGMIAANFLTSCKNDYSGSTISILKNSIPSQLLTKFRNSLDTNKGINFQLETNLENLWELLISKNTLLLTLGDSWLEDAINQKLIQPLKIEELTGWQKLPQKYQQLVTRNSQGFLSEDGEIWGAPYRWGTTMIAYRRDKLNKLNFTPLDWSDLWREEIRDRFSLPNHPREVIGLTLKKLGYSYNQENLSTIKDLKPQLQSLHQQVKFYSSDAYLQPLITGDTWLAVGWSTDIIPVVENYSNIEAVVPASGTSLWADIWVKPAQDKQTETNLVNQWIDFCWQSEAVEGITRLTNAASPIILNSPLESKIDNPLVIADSAILNKSEFILPLSTKTLEEYRYLWETIIV